MPKKKTAVRGSQHSKVWDKSMPESQFDWMKSIISAPSPVGLEAAMSYGVLKPFFEGIALKDWKIHQFKGSASIVLDTAPEDSEKTSVMLVGHADKIRLQVRSIDSNGKIWVNSDSFLPCTLIGHEVVLFSQNPKNPDHYNSIEGGTIEAIGAIHFADPATARGEKGITKEMLYLELQMHEDSAKQDIQDLGIRAGDTLILKRKIRRGFKKDTFYGAYLDNGLGCFVVAEVAKELAKKPLKNIRVMHAIATHEEIGRRGATTLAGELKPDMLIAIDVNHDYDAAPSMSSKRMNSLAMGKGFTLTKGAIASEWLNNFIEKSCKKKGVPYQVDFAGRDTGTDAMGAVMAGVDSAATSIGFPIRNMHTVSETAHTADVLAAVHGILATLRELDTKKGVSRELLMESHPNLMTAKPLLD